MHTPLGKRLCCDFLSGNWQGSIAAAFSESFFHNLLMNFQSSQKDHFTSCFVIPVAKMKLQCLLPGGSINMSSDSFTTG